MEPPSARARRLVGALAGVALLVAAATACSPGGTLEHVVADTVVQSKAWETAVLVEPDAVDERWAQVGGAPTAPPDGHVAVLVSAGYLLAGPEVTAVRATADGWVVEVRSERLADGCGAVDVVLSVTFLLHVRAGAPPDGARVEVTEHEVGC